MDDTISNSLIKADCVLLHQQNRTFIFGARTLNVIVRQAGAFEQLFKGAVGFAQCAVRGKRRRHIDLVLHMRWSKAVLPIGCHRRLRTCRNQREASEESCERCSKQYSASIFRCCESQTFPRLICSRDWVIRLKMP